MKIKQVILIRKNLKMRRGKEIAQGSHAAMQFIVSRLRNSRDANICLQLDERTITWINNGMPKIRLRVNSVEELVTLHEKARSVALKSFLIRESGRTEFAGVPTLTACSLEPDPNDHIDQVIGDLVPY